MSYVDVFEGTITVGADSFRQIAGVFRATDNGATAMRAHAAATPGVEAYVDGGDKPIAVIGDARPGYYVNANTQVVAEAIDRVGLADTRKAELQQLLLAQYGRAGIDVDSDLLKAIQQMVIAFAEADDANRTDDTRWGYLRAWAAANPNELDYRLSVGVKTTLAATAGGAGVFGFYALPALTGTGIVLGAALPANTWAASPTHGQVESTDRYAYFGFA